MKKKTNKFNILVLTDFSESSGIAIRNAAKLAKLVNGQVRAYYVKSLKPFAEEENQIALSRRLRKHYMETHTSAKKMMSFIEEEEGVRVHFSMDFGNVKNCVSNKVQSLQPDLLILGKRKPKLINFIGDKLTQHLIKRCEASILISSSSEVLHSLTDLSLGYYGETIAESNLNIIQHLQETKHPVNFFGIRNRALETEAQSEPQKKGRSFIFPQEGVKAIEALTSYVSRSNTQLFCIHNGEHLDSQPVKHMVNNLNVPILIYK